MSGFQMQRLRLATFELYDGIDRRDDNGSPDRFDVYYGMADNRIGVARLDVPEILPPAKVADPPEEKVWCARLRQFKTVKGYTS